MVDSTPIKSFRFRDLPSEVRTATAFLKYQFLIMCCTRYAKKYIASSSANLDKIFADFLDISDLLSPTHLQHEVETAILRTSKETYREAYDAMAKTNRFVKITSVEGIPMQRTLCALQAPIVSMQNGSVNKFKGYVLAVHLDYKSRDTPRRNDHGPGLQAFSCMVLHRDMQKVCESINDGDAHRKGVNADMKMCFTVAPILDAMQASTISPFFDDFFTKKTQEALLKPFTAIMHG